MSGYTVRAIAHASFLAAFLLIRSLSGVLAQEAAPQEDFLAAVSVVSVWTSPEAEAFSEPLTAALLRELAAVGFLAQPHGSLQDTSSADAELADRLFASTRSRWASIARCDIDDKRLVWRVSVYDALDGALIASDAQGAYPGLSALALLDQSAAAVAQDAWGQRERTIPALPIEYRLRFSSPDPGARVSFGTGEGSREAGIIDEGKLVAPFTAFRAGHPVVVSIEKEGYWTKVKTLHPGPENKVIALPQLMPRARDSLALGFGTAHPVGAVVEYRRFLSEDAVFARASDSLWLQHSFTPGSVPVLHDEVRLGFGSYVFLPRDAEFRLSVSTGFSGIFTLALPENLDKKFYFDASFDALSLGLEWHKLRSYAFYLETRLAYSLGLDSGILARGWIRSGTMPALFSWGVIRKW